MYRLKRFYFHGDIIFSISIKHHIFLGNLNAVGTEDQKFKFEGREGLFTQTKSVHDRYAERPNLVENLTLSQFVTSYTNCKKLPKKYKLFNNASKETGLICEHLTGLSLPLYIRLSTNENFRLRRFSTVLQLHSSKKDGDEEFFAEVQLFSLWRRPDLDDWRNNCIEEFRIWYFLLIFRDLFSTNIILTSLS